ncbi:hypothetical protein [Epilithonimonas lactis]|uniref:HEPN domain-containing protein n=1 Tax=Epilithonimonas lactis TaxID=421072 RepID=A0A085BJG0_9FLAO|nr:hypothetical protein [Epilithonimonas lactis]KFC22605.1 hypothetical protein IO89_06000 [Epilithonimonas lactis]SEQ81814.1 hypothetical protein SAMN04488097_3115 [Epilithonimonas lactis]
MSSISESIQILNQAERFKNSADLLFANVHNDVNSYFIPAQVLAALSIELHIKALALFENGTYSRGHDIFAIYKKLSAKTQLDIKEMMEKKIIQFDLETSNQRIELEKISGVEISKDLDKILQDISLIFVNIRYIFDKQKPISFYYIDLVRIVLEDFCQKIKL